MGRILGLDVGSKTIGVSISDEIGSIAFPGKTILRQEGKKRDMASLRQLVSENSICEIVVGYPIMMDGSPRSDSYGPQCRSLLRLGVPPTVRSPQLRPTRGATRRQGSAWGLPCQAKENDSQLRRAAERLLGGTAGDGASLRSE